MIMPGNPLFDDRPVGRPAVLFAKTAFFVNRGWQYSGS
jgi:hypothetical protein